MTYRARTQTVRRYAAWQIFADMPMSTPLNSDLGSLRDPPGLAPASAIPIELHVPINDVLNALFGRHGRLGNHPFDQRLDIGERLGNDAGL